MDKPEFDHIVLLSAPAHVLVERLTARTNNPYGKNANQVEETLQFVQTVEPMLRGPAKLEIDTSAPLEHVVTAILEHVLPIRSHPDELCGHRGVVQSIR